MNYDDYVLNLRRDLDRIIGGTDIQKSARSLDEIRKAYGLHDPRLTQASFETALTNVRSLTKLALAPLDLLMPRVTANMFDAIERQRPWLDEYSIIAKASIPEAARLIGRLEREAQTRIADVYGGFTIESKFAQELESLRSIVHGITAPAGAATVATALHGWMRGLEVLSNDDGALENTFAETIRHVSRSARLLAGNPPPRTARAIERSLLLTDVELDVTTDAVVRMERTGGAEVEPAVEERTERRLLAPRLQQIDLRRAGDAIDEDVDLDVVLAAIPTGQVVLLARQIIGLITGIGEMQALSGEVPIFKVTTRSLRASAELVFGVPVSRQTFADFIDDLYWLLYEASGSGSLRYLTEHGGPFSRDECEVVFVVKRLRNYYRHDPEHGSNAEIAKKFASIAADLRARGVARLQSRTDYRTLHRVLLQETAVFLRKLRDALIRS